MGLLLASRLLVQLALLAVLLLAAVSDHGVVASAAVAEPSPGTLLDRVAVELARFDQAVKEAVAPYRLEGSVEGCCCDQETVQSGNIERLQALQTLTASKFFRYFKVNFLKPCPFWVEQTVCSVSGEGGCSICECSEDEIPKPWLNELTHPVNKDLPVDHPSWDEEDDQVWIAQENTEAEMMYVDMVRNPERFTGYSGYNASKIWMAIYMENCFLDKGDNMCLEERVFYRLISGLHGSTTIHICENYHTKRGTAPNVDFFMARMGAFPDRMNNVYFTGVFLMRAVAKLRPFLEQYSYEIGDAEEEAKIKSAVSSFLRSPMLSSCEAGFDETRLFLGENAALKPVLREKFRNVSMIMDCVTCETCKVHAKLQVLGIATAMKILIAEDVARVASHLQRNEIIALFNTLEKFSNSINVMRLMRQRVAEQTALEVYVTVGSLVFLVINMSIWLRCVKPHVMPTTRRRDYTERWKAESSCDVDAHLDTSDSIPDDAGDAGDDDDDDDDVDAGNGNGNGNGNGSAAHIRANADDSASGRATRYSLRRRTIASKAS